jgi:pyrroloquinoline quinone (PQQ) biosynthesis protein C
MGTSESAAHHSQETENRIRDLAESVRRHPALNNDFYKLWLKGPLSVPQVELFARNYYERVSRTPERLALSFLHVNNVRARAETAMNLNDEMGEGNPARAHSVILAAFLEKLLSKLHGHPVDFDRVQAPVVPSTVKLIKEGERLFGSDDPAVSCGALLAQEWHAYMQIVYVYEGCRNYLGYFGLEEFHDSCEYFYLHIGTAEKQHKIQSVSTAVQLCGTPEQFARLEDGFNSYLDLLAANWQEICDYLNRM